MGVNKGLLSSDSVYIDYPFEEVMFRWDGEARAAFRKFYGKQEFPTPVPHDNRLWNEALNYGDLITAQQYADGKDRGEH